MRPSDTNNQEKFSHLNLIPVSHLNCRRVGALSLHHEWCLVTCIIVDMFNIKILISALHLSVYFYPNED